MASSAAESFGGRGGYGGIEIAIRRRLKMAYRSIIAGVAKWHPPPLRALEDEDAMAAGVAKWQTHRT